MMTCKNCGAAIDETAKFCTECGAPVSPDTPTPVPALETPAPFSGPAGYSRLTDSEEVVKALKKTKRASNLFLAIFVLLPFLGFLIYGAISDKMDFGKAAVYGLIVSGIFAFVSIIVALKNKLTKPFEGVVTDKKKSFRAASANSRTGKSRTKYVIRFECEDGKRRKKEVSIPVFEYLEVGDKVRFLPQFPQPYEKYDKRADGEVLCMFCSKKNPLTETKCAFCHNVLIK